jgi:GT2 family glycosyltransferase
MEGIDGEIIVVDNASVDHTVSQLHQHFPDIHVIANRENKGFATANNQAIATARGEYILLLNPDTIVSGDTFEKCVSFMDKHPDAGALGVRMIDGTGRFLPESKRGLPTLSASFMKMTGLYKLFPRSAQWNRYYQGHIAEQETARIEVLCGAYMFIRRAALEKSGYLDEDFFMYGEDIDLSYRITKAGYAIYYYPETSIIHYKGESTKKSSLNYILTFYEAMLIFTDKHPEFKGQKLLIKPAIYFHGALQLVRQNADRWWPVILDLVLISMSFLVVAQAWARFYFGNPEYYTDAFYKINVPLYTGLMLLAMHLNGAYDRPFMKRASWSGLFSGVLVILAVYAMLPVELRSSRMVILTGTLAYLLFMVITRAKCKPWNAGAISSQQPTNRNAIIIAGTKEAERIKELINRSRDHIDILATIDPGDNAADRARDLPGYESKLEDLVRIYDVREIIFSAMDVPFSSFTGSMSRLGPSLRYMLAASTTMNIVGSMGKDIAGESYAIEIHFNLSRPSVRRLKRVFDFMLSLVMLLVYPIVLFFIPQPRQLLRNIFNTLFGNTTWVSYHPLDPLANALPVLKKGVLHPAYPTNEPEAIRRLQHIHYVYARDYHWTTDLSIFFSQFKRTGQKL